MFNAWGFSFYILAPKTTPIMKGVGIYEIREIL